MSTTPAAPSSTTSPDDPGREPTDWSTIPHSPPQGTRALLVISGLICVAVISGFCYQRLRNTSETPLPPDDLNTVTSGIANHLSAPRQPRAQPTQQAATVHSPGAINITTTAPALPTPEGLTWLTHETPQDPVLARRLGSPLQANSTAKSPSQDTSAGGTLKPVPAKSVVTVQAEQLPHRNFLVTQGTLIDCILQTRLISTQPGLLTCLASHDVMSASGKVILIDRGSRFTGQPTGVMEHGQARIFIRWDRLETPTGVVLELSSPGSGALGEGGVAGAIDSHFTERFGHAVLTSLVQDLSQWAQSPGPGTRHRFRQITDDTGVALGRGADVAGAVLQKHLDIPPTLYKNQGERVGIMVARDLDFSQVYSLKPVTSTRPAP